MSDWLTKSLVGVGLVEINKLNDVLVTAGAVVAGSFHPPLPGAAVITQVTMVAFAIIGFFAGYLWTRVYYGPLQAEIDNKVIAALLPASKTPTRCPRSY